MLMRALLHLRMRPRVQRAPGIPCALWPMEGHVLAKTRAHSRRENAKSHPTAVIPGREAKRREPGIHPTAIVVAQWIPGSRKGARPGMTTEREARPGMTRERLSHVTPSRRLKRGSRQTSALMHWARISA